MTNWRAIDQNGDIDFNVPLLVSLLIMKTLKSDIFNVSMHSFTCSGHARHTKCKKEKQKEKKRKREEKVER